jgi:hypothetical protein
MSELGDDFRAMRDARQARHAEMREKNMAAIEASGIRFQERPAALLFRNAGYPKVDFYPDTGRWGVMGNPHIYRGGATAFLSWYETHKKT